MLVGHEFGADLVKVDSPLAGPWPAIANRGPASGESGTTRSIGGGLAVGIRKRPDRAGDAVAHLPTLPLLGSFRHGGR